MVLSKKTIVIPCYNEGGRLNIEAYKAFLQGNNFFAIFVNDGSTDNTSSLLKKLSTELPDLVIVLDLPVNKGKAEAVRQGMRYALETGSEQIAFIDADMAVSLTELRAMFVEVGKYSFVFGSRIRTLNNNIERSLLRHYLSRFFATIVSTLLDLPVYDTQCGAKIFTNDLAAQIFEKEFYSRWLFDVEIFFRLKNLYSKREIQALALEYPLKDWQAQKGSTLRLSDFFKAPFKLWLIRKKYKQASFNSLRNVNKVI